MYYGNFNLLCDIIKINLLIPKLYSISIINNIDNIERYVKYHNKLAKNINKYYQILLYNYIELDELYNFKYNYVSRNVPPSINTKYCFFDNKISFNNILSAYEYINGIDSIIYHKINKTGDVILFLIYKLNGLLKNKCNNHNKLKYTIDIWNSMHKLDYALYYKLNSFLKKNPSIDYIRCTLSTNSNMNSETLYLNIINNIPMYCKFNINILFYRQNNVYYIDNPLIFNSHKKYDDNTNEIIFITKNYNIGIYRQNISEECKYIKYNLEKYNDSMSIILKFKNNKTFKIKQTNLYLLSYYDITNIDSKIFIYMNNNNEKSFFSNILVEDGSLSIDLKSTFVYNYKMYDTLSDIERICIYNNIYDNVKHDFQKIGITNNETLHTSITKLKNSNNIILFKKMNKLLNKTVKYHIKIISDNIDENYKYLFDFLTYIHKISL
ncbi:unknown similar to AMEV173 [Adoxophyes honmai entomopoxvirus 'L']|uniref:Uncharacterized protein n=1 Tax=Adoxophyes honmai entomopoxvirus 'L' TaxID=1293540 RepID=A0A916KP39_9POXV|nr:unknown similar to AMEV173 [Adoxophyes honmai entomopoxvirus 'L']CCU55481.1 unknown similar to AMEV173 [Adoxophyes honmai entomopoxvirus 'L']